jgi:hypothetical protein
VLAPVSAATLRNKFTRSTIDAPPRSCPNAQCVV